MIKPKIQLNECDHLPSMRKKLVPTSHLKIPTARFIKCQIFGNIFPKKVMTEGCLTMAFDNDANIINTLPV